VPPCLMCRRLKYVKPDVSIGVPVGDLGHPRSPLALPYAMVVAMRWRRVVGGGTSSTTRHAPGAADGRRGAAAGRSAHLQRGCGVGRVWRRPDVTPQKISTSERSRLTRSCRNPTLLLTIGVASHAFARTPTSLVDLLQTEMPSVSSPLECV
jgi:hypothetical protein